jgi:hypothetical protein
MEWVATAWLLLLVALGTYWESRYRRYGWGRGMMHHAKFERLTRNPMLDAGLRWPDEETILVRRKPEPSWEYDLVLPGPIQETPAKEGE